MEQMERKRMCADERLQIMNYAVGIDALEISMKALEKRMKSCKTWGKARGAIGIITKAFDDICYTIPVEQLISLKRNMELMSWDYHVKSPMGKKTIKDDGMWMPLTALDELVDATTDRCLTCSKDPLEQRKCPLAKALDLLPIDRADESHNGCKYYNGL